MWASSTSGPWHVTFFASSALQALRNAGMRPRHWDQVSATLGFPLNPDAKFTLKKAEEMNL